MHFYAHHIGDFLKDTSSLTPEESYYYLRLIWLYYDTEKPLPDDIPSLAFKIGARGKDDLVRNLIQIYFRYDSDLKSHTHQRIEDEIRKYQGKAASAKRANQIRWGSEKNVKSDVKSDAKQIVTINQEPVTINQEPVTNNQEPVTKDKQNNSLSTDTKPTKIDINFSYNQKHKDLAQELNLAIDLERDKFVDYYLNKTNKKFLDWDAAFRNWLRKAAEFAKTAKTSNRACPPTEQESAQADEYRKQFIQIGEKGGSL